MLAFRTINSLETLGRSVLSSAQRCNTLDLSRNHLNACIATMSGRNPSKSTPSHHDTDGRFNNPWDTWKVSQLWHVSVNLYTGNGWACQHSQDRFYDNKKTPIQLATLVGALQESGLRDVLKWQYDRRQRKVPSGGWLVGNRHPTSQEFLAAFPVHKLERLTLSDGPGNRMSMDLQNFAIDISVSLTFSFNGCRRVHFCCLDGTCQCSDQNGGRHISDRSSVLREMQPSAVDGPKVGPFPIQYVRTYVHHRTKQDESKNGLPGCARDALSFDFEP